MLGGGNVKKLKECRQGRIIGSNENAFIGGLLIGGEDCDAHPIVDLGTAAGSGVGTAPAGSKASTPAEGSRPMPKRLAKPGKSRPVSRPNFDPRASAGRNTLTQSVGRSFPVFRIPRSTHRMPEEISM